MKRVLIISADFFGYHISVGKAFESFGFETFIETYDEPIHPFKGLLKWRHKFSLNREKLCQESREKYHHYIQARFDAIKPDLVFIFNGTILLSQTLDYFRSQSKVVLWMYDSILRPDRKNCISHIDHVDSFFCFEQKDVDYYEHLHKHAYFLPVACDPSVYFPTEHQHDIDILFAGMIYISSKRKRILKRVVREFPDLNIKIYGLYKPYYKNPLSWLFRGNRSIYLNRNVEPTELNELYGRTKIALNIHNAQTFNGANPRLFEAACAGAYQICDTNPYIQSIFPHNEIGLYDSDDVLIELIRDELHKNHVQAIKQARDIVLNNHTFTQRVKTIIDTIHII